MRLLAGSQRKRAAATPILCAAFLVFAGQATALSGEADARAAQDEVERYCTNIADEARDRRYVLQTRQLEKLKTEVDARIAALEEKRKEYEGWLGRRDAFLAKAEDNLVQIYSSMRPDAAAERLAEVRVDLAAAILMKLEPRTAGIILNEMNSKAAATITGIMASAGRPEDPS